jgi:hypothetical protein
MRWSLESRDLPRVITLELTDEFCQPRSLTR